MRTDNGVPNDFAQLSCRFECHQRLPESFQHESIVHIRINAWPTWTPIVTISRTCHAILRPRPLNDARTTIRGQGDVTSEPQSRNVRYPCPVQLTIDVTFLLNIRKILPPKILQVDQIRRFHVISDISVGGTTEKRFAVPDGTRCDVILDVPVGCVVVANEKLVEIRLCHVLQTRVCYKLG